MFEELYADPARLEQFMGAMSGISPGNFEAFAEKFDFSQLQDPGRHRRRDRPALHRCRGAASASACTTLDLPAGASRSPNGASRRPAGGRVTPATVDFFKDQFPKADLITMGMILHDWNLENKKMLIAKAYARCRRAARWSPSRTSSRAIPTYSIELFGMQDHGIL